MTLLDQLPRGGPAADTLWLAGSQSAHSSPAPILSLIIVHYHRPDSLRRMLLSIRNEDVPLEVIVVNSSPDVELPLPRSSFKTRVVPYANRGYARGCNAGLALAAGEFIAACNDDLLFPPGVLSTAVKYLERNPSVGVLAPALTSSAGRPQNSARRFYTWPVVMWARCPLRRDGSLPSFYRRHLLLDQPSPSARDVDWAIGAALFVRRSALADPSRVFDPRYFLYFEDVDLCADMWRRGWKVVQLPSLHIEHHYSRASRRLPSPAAAHHCISLLKFLLKHRGLPRRTT